MPKVKIRFTETVDYEVEVSVPDDVDVRDLYDDDDELIRLVDEQRPEWITKDTLAVRDREVTSVDVQDITGAWHEVPQ